VTFDESPVLLLLQFLVRNPNPISPVLQDTQRGVVLEGRFYA